LELQVEHEEWLVLAGGRMMVSLLYISNLAYFGLIILSSAFWLLAAAHTM
jgi:hypothetical protein